MGRLFEPNDFEPGAGLVAVVGHSLWENRWGGGDVLGTELELNGVAHTIVGVMDRSYRDPEPVESGPIVQVWVPARENDPEHDRGDFSFRVIGRLASGTSVEAAQRQLTAIGARLAEAYPDPNRMDGNALDFALHPLKQTTIGAARDRLLMLLGASALLLLLACANVASLFLTRGSARIVELSIRSTLGASRGRIARQLLTESIAIAAIGGALGALLGGVGMRAFVAVAPGEIPRLWETTFDLRIAAFVFAATGLTGVAFGSLPALRSSRLAASAMRETRATMSRRSLRAQTALISIEVALALVLVTGSALLLRSFVRLMHVDPGFDPDGVLAVDVRPPAAAKTEDLRRLFYDQLADRMRAIAGVRYAALSYSLPGAPGGSFSRVTPEGPPNPELARRFVRNNPVTHDWFAALAIPLRSGRLFTGDQRAGAPSGIVINEAAARAFFPGEDSPVGRRLKLGAPDADEPMLDVIGVVGDIRHGLGTDPEPEIFLPLGQQATFRMMLTIKLHDGVAPPIEAIHAAVREVGPDVPIDLVSTMHDRLASTTAQARFLTSLVTAFAALALLLAVVGTYATASYAVSRRLTEVGIRMALGARPASVFLLVVLSNAAAAGLGVIMGLALTLFLSRYLEAYVFGITAQDPATVVLACALISAAATLAAIGPATRAARLDPNEVLRAG
jgi:predicted permease